MLTSLMLALVLSEAPEIPAGTHVLLRMINSVNTATAQVGDFVYMTTASPLSVGGRIVVPVGAHVQGLVVHAKRSGRVSGRAELALRLETLTLHDGRVLKFSPQVAAADPGGTEQKTSKEEGAIKQGSDAGRDAARVAILAGTGAATGAAVGHWTNSGWQGAGVGAGIGAGVGVATALLTRGREVELRAGSTLDVFFTKPVPLE